MQQVQPLPPLPLARQAQPLARRTRQAQLLAEAAGEPKAIPHEVALSTRETVGSPLAGWFSFQPLYDVITEEQPELLE